MSIPPERTKNHSTLELTLPPAAIELLQATPRRDGRPYIFGKRGGPFSAWSYSVVVLNNRIAAMEGKPLPRWALHDLRRSMRSGLGRLGIPPHIAELAIGHVKGGIEAVYDKYRYEREIKAALALWAEHVLAVVQGRESNVIPMMRA